MIKTRNLYRVCYVDTNIKSIYVAANSFGSASSVAALISDDEVLSITKLELEINVKFD